MSTELTCRDGVARLMDYTEGRLDAGRRRRIEAHVRGCKRCQWFVRGYTDVPRLLREATTTRMPAGLVRRLQRLTTRT